MWVRARRRRNLVKNRIKIVERKVVLVLARMLEHREELLEVRRLMVGTITHNCFL